MKDPCSAFLKRSPAVHPAVNPQGLKLELWSLPVLWLSSQLIHRWFPARQKAGSAAADDGLFSGL